MSTVTPAWQCSNCGEWHDCEDYALECCAPAAVDGWKCEACGDYHKLKDNAVGCCGYLCSACQQWGDSDSLCESCGHDIGADINTPTPAELEAAGQQRLAL